ncbi:MAG: hypothetical protein HQL33_11450, partial [Alphaproteobacteria bacterium]|nr:hypothetical protein [Alphaproteobacteria bacterium]
MMLGPRHLTLLSRAAFVGLALFPSLGFLSFQYLQESGLVARDAHIQAHQINGVIARNPEGWQYKTHWLLNAAVVVRRENT